MSEASLEIKLDRDRCSGSGSCSFQAPKTFDLDDAGKVVLLDGRDSDDRIRAAVDSCPSGAIIVVERAAEG